MQTYEIMTITDIKLGESAAKKLSTQVQEEIKALGGEVKETNFWGKRKFAYPVNHETDGFYDVVLFELAQDKVKQLKSKLNLVEGLVRYLITTEGK